MKKRIIVMLLVSALVISATGCGGKTDDASGAAAAETEEKSEEQPADIITEEAMVEEDTEEAAAEADTGAESTESEDQDDIINNGGYFVKYGDTVYFHAPDKEGMKTTGLFGEFLFGESGTTELFAHDTKTGDVSSVLKDHSWDGLYICGDKMYLEQFVMINDNPADSLGVYDIPKDFDTEYMDGEMVMEASPDGGTVVTGYFDGDKEGYILHVRTSAGDDYTVDEITDVQRCELCDDDRMFYTTYNYNTNIFGLYEYDYGKDSIYLGELPACPDASSTTGPGVIKDMIEDGDKVYFGVNYYEGTGHFLAHSFLVSAVIGKEDSISSEEAQWSAEGDADPTEPSFVIENGAFNTNVDGTPGSAGVDADGILVYYDEKGKAVTVAQGYGTKSDADGNLESLVEGLSLVDGRIYGYRHELERAPEEDIGWRMAYRRTKTTVFSVDVTSGEETELHVTEA